MRAATCPICLLVGWEICVQPGDDKTSRGFYAVGFLSVSQPGLAICLSALSLDECCQSRYGGASTFCKSKGLRVSCFDLQVLTVIAKKTGIPVRQDMERRLQDAGYAAMPSFNAEALWPCSRLFPWACTETLFHMQLFCRCLQ